METDPSVAAVGRDRCGCGGGEGERTSEHLTGEAVDERHGYGLVRVEEVGGRGRRSRRGEHPQIVAIRGERCGARDGDLSAIGGWQHGVDATNGIALGYANLVVVPDAGRVPTSSSVTANRRVASDDLSSVRPAPRPSVPRLKFPDAVERD